MLFKSLASALLVACTYATPTVVTIGDSTAAEFVGEAPGGSAGTVQTANYCVVDVPTCIPVFKDGNGNAYVDDINKLIIETMTINTSNKAEER